MGRGIRFRAGSTQECYEVEFPASIVFRIFPCARGRSSGRGTKRAGWRCFVSHLIAQSDAGSNKTPHDDNFVIGNDDLLAISVWKETELTKSVPVRSDGKISLPLVGEIQAAGRTPAQLEKEITEKLKNFITTPEVTVVVEKVNSRKYNVLGEVTKPGSYPLTAETTVMDAIAAAGGFQGLREETGVYVLRKAPDGQESPFEVQLQGLRQG